MYKWPLNCCQMAMLSNSPFQWIYGDSAVFTLINTKKQLLIQSLTFWPFLFFALRILFWTDWDATFPRIEAASMSGGGRHIVFKDMEIGAWPNGLTLDHLEKRIVWTDARYAISTLMSGAQAFAPLIACRTLYTTKYSQIPEKKSSAALLAAIK